MPIKYYGLFTGRPALVSLTIYSLGILLAGYLPQYATSYIFIALALAAIGAIYHFKNRAFSSSILLLVALGVAGIAQYQFAISDFPPTHIKHIAASASTVTVVGQVCAEPDIRADRTYLIVEVDSLTWRKRQFQSCGRLILKLKQPVSCFAFKDRLKFRGYLFAPGGARIPGGFDYADWLGNKEVFAMMVLSDPSKIEQLPMTEPSWWEMFKLWDVEKSFVNNLVAPLRQRLIDAYYKYLPDDQASLLAGFVLGEKRDMPADVVRLFRDTGTLHLMAVSGSNVAIVVGFFLAITFWLNRRVSIIITLIAVVFFSFLTRNEPSVVRASVMAAVGLLGFYNRKNPDIIGLLGFAGLILLIMNPLWLFNLGFQLSFAACAGIVYFLPLVTTRIPRGKTILGKALYWILFTFLTTIAAQIAVLPLTAQYFNRLPIVGILANIPMIALASILTIAGILFLPFTLLGDFATTIFAWPLSQIMNVIIPLLRFFVDMPYSVVNVVSPGWLIIILFFAALYFIVELFAGKRLSFKALIATLSAMATMIWLSYLKSPNVDELIFIDCGDDRAALYCTEDSKYYLWYDHHGYDDFSQIELSLLPFLLKSGVNHIDTVFTVKASDLSILASEIHIGDIIQHSDIVSNCNVDTMAFPRYPLAESILNKRVKFVAVQTDNNIETLTDGHYYELSTSGGICILAGNLNARYTGDINHEAKVLELPWSAQPYGDVYRMIVKSQPSMLIFSPDRNTASLVNNRNKLTYFNGKTWATAFTGSLRIRLGEKLYVDYMLKP